MFHVPKQFKKIPEFMELVEHIYFKDNTKDTFSFVEQSFRGMGYCEDNDAMVHDYLHHMICDIFENEGIAFITETEIRDSESLLQLFGGYTPDIVVQSDADKGRNKTSILDVYVGCSERRIQEKKTKYKSLGVFSTYDTVTLLTLNKVLVKYVSQQKIDYLFKHYQVFMTEYRYWCSCLKLGKILLNDCANVDIEEFEDATESYTMKNKEFFSSIEAYACNLLNQTGI
jgi:hypothetical protein